MRRAAWIWSSSSAKLALERAVALGGTELGVLLGHDAHAIERAGQQRLRRPALGAALGGHRGGACPGHGGERRALVLGVALDGLDEVRHEVVAALELDVDP